MAKPLKIRLSDPTLVADTNQTLSGMFPVVRPKLTIASQRGIVVSGAAPYSVPVGSNVADVPWTFWNRGDATQLATAGYSLCHVQFANSIKCFANTWTVSIYVITVLTAPIVEMCVIRTLKDSLTTVDVTSITFGGSATPLFGTLGTKISDPVSCVVDAQHDYYFCFSGNAYGGSGEIASDNNSILNTSYAGNTNAGGAKLSVTWASSIGAGGGFGAAFPLGPGSYFITGWNLVS